MSQVHGIVHTTNIEAQELTYKTVCHWASSRQYIILLECLHTCVCVFVCLCVCVCVRVCVCV